MKIPISVRCTKKTAENLKIGINNPEIKAKKKD